MVLIGKTLRLQSIWVREIMNGAEYRIFWQELWEFVASNGPIFPGYLIRDIYRSRPDSKWSEPDCEYDSWQICYCAQKVAFCLNQRLPDHLHVYMVNIHNGWTKNYIERFGI